MKTLSDLIMMEAWCSDHPPLDFNRGLTWSLASWDPGRIEWLVGLNQAVRYAYFQPETCVHEYTEDLIRITEEYLEWIDTNKETLHEILPDGVRLAWVLREVARVWA